MFIAVMGARNVRQFNKTRNVADRKRKAEPLTMCISNSGFSRKSKVGAFFKLYAKLKGLYF